MRLPALATDLLAIDIGNSKTLAVRYVDGVERGRWRIAAAGRSAAWMWAAWRALLQGGATGVPVVVASVNPAETRRLQAAAERLHLPRPRLARWNDRWPFVLALRNPHTVGVDRLANVAGLCALGLRSGVAVDAGTAITIDVLRDGRFEGGLIVPGFDLMLRALHEHTAQLPRVASRAPRTLIGRDTAAALRAGAFHPLRAGIAAVVGELQGRLGPRARVVVTGGQGEWLADSSSDGVLYRPDLTLLGLRSLAASPARGIQNRRNTK